MLIQDRSYTPRLSALKPQVRSFDPLPEPQDSLVDRAFTGLSGALPVIGGAMNLVYGGSVSALAQSWKLGGVALAGSAANFASLPLLAGGNYLGALGLLAFSGAALEYVHRNW